MKALAEKSSQRRRLHAVTGGHVTPAPARFFQRVVVTGSIAALLALGSSALLAPGARADEAPTPAPAPAGSAQTPPAPSAAPAAPATGTRPNLPPEELERQAESIARSIMSPFCPGRTVSACPVAGPWREDIRRWVAEGVDAIEIKRRLAERVPEHNLGGVPKNRLGWVLPVGLGIGALALLIFLLRRLVGPGAGGPGARGGSGTKPADGKSPGAAAPAKATTATAPSKANGEDYDARLEEELESLER
jgi:cytochrome c-type biogenesis protein CcmH/NrfF